MDTPLDQEKTLTGSSTDILGEVRVNETCLILYSCTRQCRKKRPLCYGRGSLSRTARKKLIDSRMKGLRKPTRSYRQGEGSCLVQEGMHRLFDTDES